jgi:hypothetical protein
MLTKKPKKPNKPLLKVIKILPPDLLKKSSKLRKKKSNPISQTLKLNPLKNLKMMKIKERTVMLPKKKKSFLTET